MFTVFESLMGRVSALGLQNLQARLWASVAAIAISILIHHLIVRLIVARTNDVASRYHRRRLASSVCVLFTCIVLALMWLDDVQSAATFFGLLSAGLAIALRDWVSNLAGWAFLSWRQPFALGDRIQVGLHSGDVIDVRAFEFTIMEIGVWVDSDQSTGRVIHIPNSVTLNTPIINYSRGFQYIWNEIPVLITFESDWRKAKQILEGVLAEDALEISHDAEEGLKEAARKFLIFYSALTPIVYTAVRESGVLLTMRYLCMPRMRRSTESKIWEHVLTAFAAHPDISLAYPTRRAYDHSREGRGGLPSEGSASTPHDGTGN